MPRKNRRSAGPDSAFFRWRLVHLGVLGGAAKKTFTATLHPKLKHAERGTVSMATTPHPTNPEVRLAGSQFIVTLGDHTDYLDGRASVFAKVVEGFDVLEKINAAITDKEGHPLVDIRIKHTVAQLATVRIADDADLTEEVDEEAAEKKRREAEARAQALTLEMMGDLPFAEVKPPENILFVCKLNPVTTDADLELIFSRFGTILSCEVIRDKKTGDSLQYAFIEYEDKSAAEAAYAKMQSVLIDDRRIHVDFSQSVSKLSEVWRSGENAKRQRTGGHGGGWGGVEGLEKWRKYRHEDRRADRNDKYGLVYGDEEMRGRHARQGDRPERDDKDAGGEGSSRADDDRPRRQDGGRGRGGMSDSRRRSRSRSPRGGGSYRRDGGGDRGHGRRDDGQRRRDDRYDGKDRRDRPRDRGSSYNDYRRR
ncbi:hypothetical protein PG999_014407 [Apiospora kogelbergensis]|uniref:Peptidyl-prolyl cis-trans isomerase n=1 Tax=Apiospora kogelbergensis TaxID=1337665 RepID=A0AAW0Q6G7_9PEZI